MVSPEALHGQTILQLQFSRYVPLRFHDITVRLLSGRRRSGFGSWTSWSLIGSAVGIPFTNKDCCRCSFGRLAARRVQGRAMRRIVRDYVAAALDRARPPARSSAWATI